MAWRSEYEQRRPIALSIRASNERFSVDAGEKDDAAGTIVRMAGRATCRWDPASPSSAGVYRARWIGTVTGRRNGAFGFVDVWDGRSARRQAPGLWQRHSR